MDFKDRLKELRELKNLSQLELATKLNISNAVVSMYEKGTRQPSRETLEMIADFFNVDTPYNYLLEFQRLYTRLIHVCNLKTSNKKQKKHP